MNHPAKHGNSPVLERRLTLRDLVLFNLVADLGISCVSCSAKAGPCSLTLWILAAGLFFVPQGLAVIQLAADMPEEGGIYAWTRKELGEAHGFVCGWCYWINNVLYYPSLLLSAAGMGTFFFRKGESGLGENLTYVLPFTLIGLVVALGLNIHGIGTGKGVKKITGREG